MAHDVQLAIVDPSYVVRLPSFPATHQLTHVA
jgi:hypothetical protein